MITLLLCELLPLDVIDLRLVVLVYMIASTFSAMRVRSAVDPIMTATASDVCSCSVTWTRIGGDVRRFFA
jgi:hypothetical protein